MTSAGKLTGCSLVQEMLAQISSKVIDFFFYYVFYLAALGLSCQMQNLWLQHESSQLQPARSSSLTRDQSQDPCIESMES